MNNFTGMPRRISGSFSHDCQRSKDLDFSTFHVIYFSSHESNARIHKDLNMQHLKAQADISTEFPKIEHVIRL
jgi:hypothetical protein